jgi:hypothetical protein
MKSCKATATTLSPCVLLDPDIQELIYSVLDIKELLSVDLVCKGTRVAKDKYLKAIQSYAFNKVERILSLPIADYRVGKGKLAHIKPIDLIDGFYDCTQLDSAWKFASNMDYDLEISTLKIRKKMVDLNGDQFLESLCRKQLQRHIEDIFICHFAAWVSRMAAAHYAISGSTWQHDDLIKMVQMALHSTPELTFKLSALDTAIYRDTPDMSLSTTTTPHYRLMMSTQAHDYLQQRGISAINQRFEENNIHHLPPSQHVLYINTDIIDGNQDPIIYATGLEILHICREAGVVLK